MFPADDFEPVAAGLVVVERLKTDEGGAWSTAEMGRLFGWSEAELKMQREALRLVAWPDEAGAFHYPKWQFVGIEVMPGIQPVLWVLQSMDWWRVMRFFLCPSRAFDDQRPLDALWDGRWLYVVAVANSLHEEGTW